MSLLLRFRADMEFDISARNFVLLLNRCYEPHSAVQFKLRLKQVFERYFNI